MAAPTITSSTPYSFQIFEPDASFTITGKLTVVDPDPGESGMVPRNLGMAYTWIKIDVAGNWTWTFSESLIPYLNRWVAGASLTESFSLETIDGTVVTLSFQLIGLNDAPIVSSAIADQFATGGSPFIFQFGTDAFTDPDIGYATSPTADTLTYSATLANGNALPSWLTFNAANRTFSGTPTNGDAGIISVKVTATDTSNATVSDTFDLTIVSSNNAPTLVNAIADQLATEDSVFTFQFAADTFGDVDGDTLTYTATGAGGSALPSWLTFDAVTRTFFGMPANGDVGTVSVTVTASDDSLSAGSTFDIVVGNTNDAPVVDNAIANQSATEDSAFSFQFALNTFADVDLGDTLTYTATLADGSSLPTWLNFDAATRTFSGLPANGDVGTLSVRVTASDGTTTISDTFDITVSNTNDGPVVATAIADQSATEDAAFAFQFAANTFTDVDGDTLTYTATLSNGAPLPTWLNFDATTRTFFGLPANGDVGTLSVRVTASDGTATVSDTFNINVSNTNDAPVVANAIANQSATEDQAFSFQLASDTFADVDQGDTLTYTATLPDGSALPSWLRFDAATRTFSGTPENDDVGTISVKVMATDGSNASVSETFDIAVANTNDAPTVTGTTIEIFEGTGGFSTTGFFTINDPDANENSFQYLRIGHRGAFELQTSGQWTWTMSSFANGFYVDPFDYGESFTDYARFRTADGTEFSFAITVHGLNDAPTLSAVASNPTFIEDQGAVDLFDSVSISTIEASQTIRQLTLTVSGLADGDSEHLIIDGSTVPLTDGTAGTTTGPLSVGYAIAIVNGIATVTLTDSQGLTPADAQSLVDGLQYLNTSGNPGTTDRVVTLTSIQDSGGAEQGGADTTALSVASTIEVTAVNDGPVVANAIANQSATEDQTFAFQFAANTFTDLDGDTLTYTATLSNGAPLPTWLNFDATTRTFSGLPANGDVGTVSVKVTASDGTVTVSDTFDITVSNTNDAPVVANAIANQSATEGSAFSFQFASNTFADVDLGDTLNYTATLLDGSALPAWLSFNPGTRTFSGIPANGDVGTVSVRVTASDGSLSTSDTFDIVVSNTNDAPVVATAIADQSATEDQVFAFQFAANTFTDVDGDTLSYTATLADGSSLPTWLNFDAATHTFSGMPANGDVGTVSVRVTASDGSLSTSDTFDITVSNTNDAPVVATAIADQSATEDQAFAFQFAANTFTDVDGDTVTYTATLSNGAPLPTWLNFDAATRTFSGLPANGDVGTLSVRVTASDGTATVSDTFDITVSNTNDAPVVANAIVNQSATEDQAFAFQFASNTFADVDGDVLTYSAILAGGSALPSWLTFDAVTRTFSGVPANGDVGTLTVTVTASDGSLSAASTFDIVVGNTNDAPVVANAIANQSATEGSAFSFQFASNTFADVDLGDTLSYTATLSDGSALPAWLNFDAATRTFSGLPANGDVGTLSVRVTASDGTATISDTFDITVSNTNDAPVVATAIADQSATEDQAFAFQFAANTFTDVDGDTLTYTATLSNGAPLPSWLNFDATTRTFFGLPANGDVGTLSVRVTASDGTATISDTFDITVSNTNDAPVVATAIADQLATEDAAFAFQFAANTFTDVDGNTLTYTATLSNGAPLPAWLSFDAATRTFYGLPANGDVGTVSVRITASDGTATVSDTFDITVSNTNDAPVVATAIADQSATQGLAFTLSVAQNFSDVDAGDALTYTATLSDGSALPSWLSLDATTGTLSGMPANGDVAALDVKVTATDGANASVSQAFVLTVANVNDAPTGIVVTPVGAGGLAVAENEAGAVIGTVSTTDPDTGDTFSYGVDDARFEIVAGQLKLKAGSALDYEAEQSVAVTVTSMDAGGLSHDETVTIVVTDRNDMPVSTNTAPVVASQIADQRATSGTGFTFAIPQGAFVDPDGNPLRYSVSGLPSWLSFDAATQTFAGTPAGSDAGVAVITVTANDGALSVSDAFNLVVADSGNPDSQISLSADTVAENSARGTVIGELSGTDGDGAPFVSYALGDNPGRSFRIVDGELVVGRHAKLDFETRPDYEITVIATDRNGVSVEESLTITVSDVAENPRGTRHNDRLAGDALDNIINGKRGNDRLTGGDGADTFVFGRHTGRDIIGDFDPTEGDVIDLSRAAGIRDMADLLANHVDDSGPHLRITAGDGSVLVIRNFDNAAELTQDMFVF
jgi:VCBS repeat-containing protein